MGEDVEQGVSVGIDEVVALGGRVVADEDVGAVVLQVGDGLGLLIVGARHRCWEEREQGERDIGVTGGSGLTGLRPTFRGGRPKRPVVESIAKSASLP